MSDEMRTTYEGLTHICHDPECHVFGFVSTLQRYETGEQRDEIALRERMADLLTRTANVLHGGPCPDGSWSWHDLPDLALRVYERTRENDDG